MKPVVFINTDILTFDDPCTFDPECVAQLSEVLRIVDADVWLTSDWAQRISLADADAVLREDGAGEIASRLVGITSTECIKSYDVPYAVVDVKHVNDHRKCVCADNGFWEGEALRLTAILTDKVSVLS